MPWIYKYMFKNSSFSCEETKGRWLNIPEGVMSSYCLLVGLVTYCVAMNMPTNKPPGSPGPPPPDGDCAIAKDSKICPPVTKVKTVRITQNISHIKTVKQECPTLSVQPSTCLQSTTTKPCEPCQPTPGTARGEESFQGRSSTLALGVLTGILFTSLVAVIVGWIVTCFVLTKKKQKLTERDLQKRTHMKPQAVPQSSSRLDDKLIQNPSYCISPASYYSSSGPDYETIDQEEITQRGGHTNSEAIAHDSNAVEEPATDHTYHVQERVCDQSQGLAGPLVENKDREKTVAASYEIPVTSKSNKDI